jgi:hypothetical protein
MIIPSARDRAAYKTRSHISPPPTVELPPVALLPKPPATVELLTLAVFCPPPPPSGIMPLAVEITAGHDGTAAGD